MPLYEYQCSKCGHIVEEYQSFNDKPLEKCPHCEKKTLQRLITGGIGFIVRGGIPNSQASAMGGRYIPMDSAEQKFKQRMDELTGEV